MVGTFEHRCLTSQLWALYLTAVLPLCHPILLPTTSWFAVRYHPPKELNRQWDPTLASFGEIRQQN